MSPERLEALLVAVGAPPGDDDAPLELGSLAVIQLVDLLFATAGIALRSQDIRREHFATRRTLLALVAGYGQGA